MLIQRRTFLAALASIPVVGLVAGPVLEQTFEIGFFGQPWKFTVETYSDGNIKAFFDCVPMLVEEAEPKGWFKFGLVYGKESYSAIRLKLVDHETLLVDYFQVWQPRGEENFAEGLQRLKGYKDIQVEWPSILQT